MFVPIAIGIDYSKVRAAFTAFDGFKGSGLKPQPNGEK